MSAPVWNVISPRGRKAIAFHATMGASGSRCECTTEGKRRCQAKATCVVEYKNEHEPIRYASCCEDCRRRCFGPTAKERRERREEASSRQLLAFDVEIVEREEPQAWRR